MPIAYYQLDRFNGDRPGYAVAKELARQTVGLYGAVCHRRVGIGDGSCCAAVAVVANAGAGYPAQAAPVSGGIVDFVGVAVPIARPDERVERRAFLPVYGGDLPNAVVFGNSQLAAGGLVNVEVGGHAERAALTGARGLALYTLPGTHHAVLFVDLTPCDGCRAWLAGDGGGVANPYNGIINGTGATTLNVWWYWEYGEGWQGLGRRRNHEGIQAMRAFHALDQPLQLARINGPEW
jgi:hypothetical protein